MRTTTAGMLLILAGLSVAAPVPKENAKKLEEVFGEVTDTKSECKFEMSKDGALTITVPTAPKGSELCRPISKLVEGDFVLTTRITHIVPKGAKGVPGLAAMVSAGVMCRCETEKRLVFFKHKLEASDAGWQNRWDAVVWHPRRLREDGGSNEENSTAEWTTQLRLIRKGQDFSCDSSSDGKTWVSQRELTSKDIPCSLSVGPVAAHSLDMSYTITFDQYEINPLKAK